MVEHSVCMQILSNKITSRLESDDFNYEEAQVFYLKVKGDYYRCLTQNVEEARKEGIIFYFVVS